MGFLQAVKYGFRHWLDFKGRCPRSAYWWWLLFCFLLSVPGILLWDSEIKRVWNSEIVSWAITLFLLVPTFSLEVRRFHDSGVSGKIVLFQYLIMFPGMFIFSLDDMTYDNIYALTFLLLFYLLLLAIFVYVFIRCGFYKTQKGENKYGAALEVAKL